MLDYLKKGINLAQIKKAFIWAREAEIHTVCCLIIGQPYDTPRSINDTYEFGLELQSYGARVVYSVSTPFPGTYMYNKAKGLGLDIFDHNFDHYNTITPVYNTVNFTGQEIRSMHFEGIIKLLSGLQQHTSQAEINELASRLRKGLKPDAQRIKLS